MNIEYYEYFNNTKANYIIDYYEDVKTKFRPESEERLNNINLDPLTLFKKYVAKSKPNKSNNSIKVSYKQNKDVGRFFAVGSLSLQSLPREIRQTISEEFYYDVDIINCHPVLLQQYARANKLNYKYIKIYNNNRDELLKGYSKEFNVKKSDVKKSFLTILNGGKTFLDMKGNDIPDFVQEYKKEVVDIQQYIFENEPIYKKLGIANAKKKQELYKTKSSNELGSTMNIMLCDIENKILQCMINHLNKKDLVKSSIVMVFDGFMIPKENLNNVDIDDLLRDLEKVVREELKYKINLDVKPMKDIIKVPKDYKPKNQLKNKFVDDYDEFKSEFEKKVFKINFPISFGIINHLGDLVLVNKLQLETTYGNLLIRKYDKKGEINEVPFVNEWLKDKNMRTYDQIDFLPMQEVPSNIYNTFKGYKIMNEKMEFDDNLKVEDSLIYKHLKLVLCNNDDKTFEYMTNVLSRILKQPYNLTMTAEIFKSVQGVGKDLFFNWFGLDILGDKYYTLTQQTDKIFGRFNNDLETNILLVINETSGKDTYTINENIKAHITNAKNHVEHKGVDAFKITNNSHVVFLTNNDNSIKIEVGDRRFAAIECHDDLANDENYILPLVDEIKSKKYNMCIYKWLCSINSEKYNFTNNRPQTNLYNEMQSMNIPPLALFLKQIVIKNVDKCQSTSLFKRFNEYLEKYNINGKYSIQAFGRDINKYEGIEKTKSNNINYVFDNNKLKEHLIKKYKMEFYDKDENIDFIDDKLFDIEL